MLFDVCTLMNCVFAGSHQHGTRRQQMSSHPSPQLRWSTNYDRPMLVATNRDGASDVLPAGRYDDIRQSVLAKYEDWFRGVAHDGLIRSTLTQKQLVI